MNPFLKVSKRGRKRIFGSPNELWEAAKEYFDETSSQYYEKNDFKGRDATEVKYKIQRPFLLSGLCLYLGVNVQYFNQFEASIKGRDDDESIEFSSVITRIRQIITSQKIEGALVGAYNHNLTARLEGLSEKKEVKHSGSVKKEIVIGDEEE